MFFLHLSKEKYSQTIIGLNIKTNLRPAADRKKPMRRATYIHILPSTTDRNPLEGKMNREKFNGKRMFPLRGLVWIVAIALVLICFPKIGEQLHRVLCDSVRGPHFNPAALQRVCHDIPLKNE